MTTTASNTTLTQAASNVSNNVSANDATSRSVSVNDNSGNSGSNNGGENKSNSANSPNSPSDSPPPSLNATQFWIYQPSVLLDKNAITDLWPMPLMSVEQKLNAITRLVLLLTVLGFLVTKNINIIFTGFITLAIFVILYNTQYNLNTSSNSSDGANANASKKRDLLIHKCTTC